MDVIGPENILFASSSVNDSARKFYRLGGEGVKKKKKADWFILGFGIVCRWADTVPGVFSGGTVALPFT